MKALLVKAKTTSPGKTRFLREVKAAVEEVKQAIKGRVKLQSAKSFLNEL